MKILPRKYKWIGNTFILLYSLYLDILLIQDYVERSTPSPASTNFKYPTSTEIKLETHFQETITT